MKLELVQPPIKPMLDHALGYASRGWPVIPLNWPTDTVHGCSCKKQDCGKSSGKHPLGGQGIKHASTSPEQIRIWWSKWPKANIGLVTGGSLGVVFDFDPTEDRPLAVIQAEAEAYFGCELPPTRTVRTGGGGVHVFYKLPPDIPIGNHAPPIKGFDVRGSGSGYVVAPPSLHASGKRYTYINKSDPCGMPRQVLDRFLDNKPAAPRGGARPAQHADEHTAKRCHLWLAQRPGAVEGDNGSGDTFQVAQFIVRGFNLGPEDAWHAMKVWNDKCTPPWSDKELRHKLQDAEVSGTMAYNYMNEGLRKTSAVQLKPRANGLGLTDYDNGERLVEAKGADLMNVQGVGWHAHEGKVWREDPGLVFTTEWAAEVARAIPSEAADDKGRIELLKWSTKSLSLGKISAMMQFAGRHKDVYCNTEGLDSDPWLFNCLNGTIDLRTQTLRPHSRDDRITRLAPVQYRPAAKCPRWIEFLKEIFNDDWDLIDYVQRAAGYSLTGSVREHSLFFCYGTGTNGKSTFINVCRAVVGEYMHTANPELLMARQHEPHPTERAALRGKRWVTCSEVDRGKWLNESLTKSLTGGDKIRARFMNKDEFEFDPSHTLWILGNYQPRIKSADEAMKRRIRMIPFDVTIPDRQIDLRLQDKLLEELEGILNWLVIGAFNWATQGGMAAIPQSVQQATSHYFDDQDRLGEWVEECCELGEDYQERFSILHRSYVYWCDAENETQVGRRTFGDMLKERGWRRARGAGGSRVRKGIRLDNPGRE